MYREHQWTRPGAWHGQTPAIGHMYNVAVGAVGCEVKSKSPQNQDFLLQIV